MSDDLSDLEKRLQSLKQKEVAPVCTGTESRLAALKGPEPKPVSENALWEKLEKLKGEQGAADPRRGDYEFNEQLPESKDDQVKNLMSEIQDSVRLGIGNDNDSDASTCSSDCTSSDSSTSSSDHSSNSSQQRRRKKSAKTKAAKAEQKRLAKDYKKKLKRESQPPAFKPDPVQQAAIRRLFGNAKACNEQKDELMQQCKTHQQQQNEFLVTDSEKNGIRRIFGFPEKYSRPLPSAPDISDADVDAVLMEVMNSDNIY